MAKKRRVTTADLLVEVERLRAEVVELRRRLELVECRPVYPIVVPTMPASQPTCPIPSQPIFVDPVRINPLPWIICDGKTHIYEGSFTTQRPSVSC